MLRGDALGTLRFDGVSGRFVLSAAAGKDKASVAEDVNGFVFVTRATHPYGDAATVSLCRGQHIRLGDRVYRFNG